MRASVSFAVGAEAGLVGVTGGAEVRGLSGVPVEEDDELRFQSWFTLDIQAGAVL
jgi:hypothetical protein